MAKAAIPLDGAKLLSRYYEQVVINDFAVVESSDPAALYDWALQKNGLGDIINSGNGL